MYLVGSLLSIIIDYYFLGLTYIIVYCGAIAIIFLFVIMVNTVSLCFARQLVPKWQQWPTHFDSFY